MTHGYRDQSGKPIKSTLIDGRIIEYDTRNEELKSVYDGLSDNYDVEDFEIDIPLKGGPVLLNGKAFEEWSDIRDELK